MQKVTYIDPHGKETVIHPKATDYIFESITGIGAAETVSATTNPAGLDGSIFQGQRYESREVTLNFHVRGDGLQSLYQRRQKIIGALSAARSRDGLLGVLWYENDYGRWWIPTSVQQGPRNVGARKGNYQSMQTVFYCPDSAWRDDSAIINRLAYISGGFQFPLRIPAGTGVIFGLRGFHTTVENTGDVQAPVEISITGPATVPKIENRTTGEYLAVEKELEPGDILTISTEHRKKHATITRAGGAVEAAMNYIDPASTWLQLPAGRNNLEYTSGDDTTTSTVTVTFYPRFSGV